MKTSDDEFGGILSVLCTWPGYFLLFLMVAFPMVLTLLYVKAFLFALLLVIVAGHSVSCLSLHLSIRLAGWTFALTAVGFFFGLRGLFLGTPGATKCLQVYVVWPLVYMVLLAGVYKVGTLRAVEKTLVFSSLFIGILGIVHSLSGLNILPPIPYAELLSNEDTFTTGFYTEHVELAFPGLNSLPFLVPFLMAAIITRANGAVERRVSRIWLWLALVVDLIVVLLSGRRALQLVAVLAPLLILAVGYLRPLKERLLTKGSLRRFAIVVSLGIVLSVPLLRLVYPVTYEGIVERFSTGFDFGPTSMDDSPEARRQQYFALMQGWLDNPLIGAGLGASARGSIRSEVMPWAYELYYLDLLFQTGLVGVAAYTAGIAWIFWMGIKIVKLGGTYSQLMIPVLVGLAGLLIATGTNPYLARFDGIWVIFIPLAHINSWLARENKQSAVALSQRLCRAE